MAVTCSATLREVSEQDDVERFLKELLRGGDFPNALVVRDHLVLQLQKWLHWERKTILDHLQADLRHAEEMKAIYAIYLREGLIPWMEQRAYGPRAQKAAAS